MNILLIQENGRHAGNRDFRECFCMQRALRRLNHQCDVWGLGHANFRTPPNFKSYDAIVNLENYDRKSWVPSLSHVSKPKFLWVIDAHVRTMKPYRKTFQKGKYTLILQATRDYVDSDSVWFPNCYDCTLIHPMDIPKEVDVGFCGNVVTLAREQYLKVLEIGYGPRFRRDIFVIGKKMVWAINSYRIHFNFNIANDVNYRNFETMGCGVPLVTNANDQYEALGMKHGENCMIWTDERDLLKKIDALFDTPGLWRRVARGGYELARRHTYVKRAARLVQLIQERS